MTPLLFALRILMALVFALGLFKLTDYILVLPSGSTKKTVRYMFGEKSFKERLQELTVDPFSRALAKMIRLSAYKKRKMQNEFDRLSLKTTPEEFIAKNIAKSILIAMIGPIFILFDMTFVAVMMLILALLSYVKANKKISDKIEKLNQEIEAELPRMVETLNLTQIENKDLIKFFEQYLKVAGPAMKRILDRLVIDMKTGNIEKSLRDFDARVQSPQLSAFVATLLGVTHGIDQRTVLIVMEKDLRARQRENLRRLADKKPGKVRMASIALVFAMIILMMVPLAVMLIKEFGAMGLT
jgi:hypothetical protein